MLTKTQKNEKGPLSHRKINGSFLDYVQLLILAKWSEQKCWPKCKKMKKAPCHWKIKCSFLDYVYILMIGWVIRAKNVDWNAKKQKRPPKSLKNKMFVFLIMFNFWWLAEQSGQKMLTETQKNEKGPLSLKNKMFIFGLCLHSDDRLSDLSKNVDRKAKK